MVAAAARHDVLPRLNLVRPADIADTGDTGRQRRQRADALRAGRQRFEQFVRDDRLPPNVLDVHNRRRASDRDRLGEVADRHYAFNVGCEAGAQHEAFAANGLEALQREHHGVVAGSQSGDRVASFAVGHDGTLLLDEHWAGCRDGHTWQDRPGIVFGNAGDPGILCTCCERKQHETRKHSYPDSKGTHPNHLASLRTIATTHTATETHSDRSDLRPLVGFVSRYCDGRIIAGRPPESTWKCISGQKRPYPSNAPRSRS